jgi:transposase
MKTTNQKETWMRIMAGIDLHSNNAMCAVVNMEGQRLLHKKVPCRLSKVVEVLDPYKAELESVAVESTFNWYWLVDGLQDHGYKVVLANPAQIQQYEGIKELNDKSEAYFLAELLRLGVLPTGHIYDRQIRPVRDLLRRRMSLVQKRTALYLSFKSLYARSHGINLPLRELKQFSAQQAQQLYTHECDQLIAGEQVELIKHYDQSIAKIERKVSAEVAQLPYYRRLQSLPGIGPILALTITLESGPIERFASAGDYASYCRCVESKRLSNGKLKGRNNGKCGNKYLGWGFVEGANFARRYDLPSRRFFDRKEKQRNSIVATKALACKLSKAAWHIMSEDVNYDPRKVFPNLIG